MPGTGSRVQGAVRQAADGTCTGEAISFSSSASYTLTINDFMVPGGDGYPNVSGRAHTQDLLEQDLADYLAAQPGGVISPAIQGRVHCTDSDPGTAPACPPGSRSLGLAGRREGGGRGAAPLALGSTTSALASRPVSRAEAAGRRPL